MVPLGSPFIDISSRFSGQILYFSKEETVLKILFFYGAIIQPELQIHHFSGNLRKTITQNASVEY